MMLNTKMITGAAVLALLSVCASAAGDRQTRKRNLRKQRRNKMIHSNNNNNNNVDITEDVAFWTRSLQSSFPPPPTPVPPPTPSGGV